MVISKLNVISKLKVVNAIVTEIEAGISFENGISLAIYNRFELVGFSFSEARMLIGELVNYVDEKEHLITIVFGNNWAIRIDMRDEAYTGPESIQLRIPGESIVIWN